MLMGKVVGSVWATQKEAGMENLKLLIVKPLDFEETEAGKMLIAADRIGAGVGERVIVTQGTPAHILSGEKRAPIDAAVVGIVDSSRCNRP
ncbi:EutN/CcmL family microcompartment protein [Scopulibacillus cellulosilyticus]|uniref:EutN/CcmL family microcompartment protein n=1 Tax=Scopulibacillus cellulosilyticus TaxID=2665665 RepID=A0ABW2PUA0_9BACL